MIAARMSFSKAALAERCAYWLRPDVQWRANDNEESAGGRAVHSALADLVNTGHAALPDDATLRAMFVNARAWLEPRRVLGMRSEVAYAYDVAGGTARELVDPPGLEGTRWYADAALRAEHGLADSEVPGRLDLVCMGLDEKGPFARIWDYKFHWDPEGADARAQLELCALAVCLAYGVERVQAVAVHVWADRDVEEEAYEFHDFDLEMVARDFTTRMRQPPETVGTNDGPWCKARKCDARVSCPVTLRALKGLEDAIPPEKLLRPEYSLARPPTTNEEGAAALVRMGLVEDLLKAREADTKALADALSGIVLDGAVYSGKAQLEEKADLSIPGAVELLEQMGLDFAIVESTTWSAIKEAGGAEGAQKAETVREGFRAIGALKTSEKVVYRARAVKAEKKPRRKAS